MLGAGPIDGAAISGSGAFIGPSRTAQFGVTVDALTLAATVTTNYHARVAAQIGVPTLSATGQAVVSAHLALALQPLLPAFRIGNPLLLRGGAVSIVTG